MSAKASPKAFFDQQQEQSRAWKVWTKVYMIPSFCTFLHFGTLVVATATVVVGSDEISDAAKGLLFAEVAMGFIIRFVCLCAVLFLNGGGILQVCIAVCSPLFWSLAYGGGVRSTDWSSSPWRLPGLYRFMMGLVCAILEAMNLLANDIGGQGFMFITKLSGWVFGAMGLIHAGNLAKQVIGSQQGSPEFVMGVGIGQIYTMCIDVSIMRRLKPRVLFAFSTAGFVEFLFMAGMYLLLESVYTKGSYMDRLRACIDKGWLLSGTLIVNDLKANLGSTEDETVNCTWVCKDDDKGEWRDANVLLPGPSQGWKIEDEIVGEVMETESGHDDSRLLAKSTRVRVISLKATQREPKGNVKLSLDNDTALHFRGNKTPNRPATFDSDPDTVWIKGHAEGKIALPIV